MDCHQKEPKKPAYFVDNDEFTTKKKPPHLFNQVKTKYSVTLCTFFLLISYLPTFFICTSFLTDCYMLFLCLLLLEKGKILVEDEQLVCNMEEKENACNFLTMLQQKQQCVYNLHTKHKNLFYKHHHHHNHGQQCFSSLYVQNDSTHIITRRERECE